MTIPSLNFDTAFDACRISVGITSRMANSVDHYEPSHLDLYCLQRYLYWYVERKATGQEVMFSLFDKKKKKRETTKNKTKQKKKKKKEKKKKKTVPKFVIS